MTTLSDLSFQLWDLKHRNLKEAGIINGLQRLPVVEIHIWVVKILIWYVLYSLIELFLVAWVDLEWNQCYYIYDADDCWLVSGDFTRTSWNNGSVQGQTSSSEAAKTDSWESHTTVIFESDKHKVYVDHFIVP